MRYDTEWFNALTDLNIALMNIFNNSLLDDEDIEYTVAGVLATRRDRQQQGIRTTPKVN